MTVYYLLLQYVHIGSTWDSRCMRGTVQNTYPPARSIRFFASLIGTVSDCCESIDVPR